MKEFIEKLIGRLEEKKNLFAYKCVDYAEGLADAYEQSINIVNQLAEEYRNDKVCQTAIMYAENLHKYGVQIDSIWETATQQSMALNQAYMRGRQDERDIFDEWQEEYINTSTDSSTNLVDTSTDTSTTNADRIRSMTDEELAEFFEKLEVVCDMCVFDVGCLNVANGKCKDGLLKWLQSEVEGVTENE